MFDAFKLFSIFENKIRWKFVNSVTNAIFRYITYAALTLVWWEQ